MGALKGLSWVGNWLETATVHLASLLLLLHKEVPEAQIEV